MNADLRVDDLRSIRRTFTATQVRCRKCAFMMNDDVYGDARSAYEELADQAGGRTPPRRLATRVAEAAQEARRLPALTDAGQSDYDSVRHTWGCAGLHTIADDDLVATLGTIFGGYYAEGAWRDEIETLDQGVMMLSFFTVRGWRPVRLARTTTGDFTAYGQIQLYRTLAA